MSFHRMKMKPRTAWQPMPGPGVWLPVAGGGLALLLLLIGITLAQGG